MSARAEILARLRLGRRDDPLPPPWTPPGPQDAALESLATAFSAALTNSLGEVHRCADLSEARARLGELLRQLEAEVVVANADAPLDREASELWPGGVKPHWSEDGPEDWRALCARADVGISGAESGLADTGSVLVCSGPGLSRLATLLPPIHVAFLPLSCLQPDIFAWAKSHAAASAVEHANAVFVSGPSKSADIEQTMAVGVHGPGRLIVLLYGGASD